MKWFLFLMIVLIVNPVLGLAQETGWPIVERCVPPPTEPPQEWRSDGVILATGWAGLHGIRVDLDTPYVVIWFDSLDSFSTGSALSPDGKWFAFVEAKIFDGPLFADWIEVAAIKIFSTVQSNSVYELPWNATIGGRSDDRTINTIRWLNDELLIFQDIEGNGVVINPFNEAVQPIGLYVTLPQFEEGFYPSPDWTRVVVRESRSTNDGEWKLFDLQTGEALKTFFGSLF